MGDASAMLFAKMASWAELLAIVSVDCNAQRVVSGDRLPRIGSSSFAMNSLRRTGDLDLAGERLWFLKLMGRNCVAALSTVGFGKAIIFCDRSHRLPSFLPSSRCCEPSPQHVNDMDAMKIDIPPLLGPFTVSLSQLADAPTIQLSSCAGAGYGQKEKPLELATCFGEQAIDAVDSEGTCHPCKKVVPEMSSQRIYSR